MRGAKRLAVASTSEGFWAVKPLLADWTARSSSMVALAADRPRSRSTLEHWESVLETAAAVKQVPTVKQKGKRTKNYSLHTPQPSERAEASGSGTKPQAAASNAAQAGISEAWQELAEAAEEERGRLEADRRPRSRPPAARAPLRAPARES